MLITAALVALAGAGAADASRAACGKPPWATPYAGWAESSGKKAHWFFGGGPVGATLVFENRTARSMRYRVCFGPWRRPHARCVTRTAPACSRSEVSQVLRDGNYMARWYVRRTVWAVWTIHKRGD